MKFTEYDTRVAGYAVIVNKSRILLTWFNGAGRQEPGWTLPGGGVEYEETIEAAIVREVREESGYDVVLGRPLFTHTFVQPVTWEAGPQPSRPFKSVQIGYMATVSGGQLGTLEEGGTTDHAAWLTLDEAVLTDSRMGLVNVAVAAYRQEQGR